MNRYALWKYLVILIAFCVGGLYTLPNFFGEAPAVQVSSGKATVKVRVTATLPRFASQEHKDPRAPQNLYPIAGLERALRRRLGDARLLYRSLREASK